MSLSLNVIVSKWVSVHTIFHGEMHTGVIAAVMEWRQQSVVSCERAFQEAQRWLEVMTPLSSISPCWPQKCKSFHPHVLLRLTLFFGRSENLMLQICMSITLVSFKIT